MLPGTTIQSSQSSSRKDQIRRIVKDHAGLAADFDKLENSTDLYRAGIVKMPPSNRKTFLENWFAQHILTLYRERTILIDIEVAIRWGELTAELRKRLAALRP